MLATCEREMLVARSVPEDNVGQLYLPPDLETSEVYLLDVSRW